MSWEGWLQERFPGFLLPKSMRRSVSEEEARRFLARLSGRPDHLELLQLSALFSTPERLDHLERFARRQLPDLVRRLPSTTEVQRRVWEGGFQGRLDVRATLIEHMAGQRTRFVTRARRRHFELPETLLLRAVTARLRRGLGQLRRAGLQSSEWGGRATELGDRLQHLELSTRLREIPVVPVEPRHQQAALAARHPAYESALGWHGWLFDALDREDPVRRARLLAEGALGPAEVQTRFEVAVVLRLVEALWASLEPRGWSLSQGLVVAGRRDVATFAQEDRTISVFYNQVPELPRGARDRGVQHFFGSDQRWRPDFALRHSDPARGSRWVVGEVKYSNDLSYLRQGYAEALGYRHEYGPHLVDWPKAILVVPAGITGAVSREHEVVAVGWEDWVPESVVEALVEAFSSG